MSSVVVDASVAVKWVVDEDLSERAAELLATRTLHAPDHWMAETVNAIWGKVFRGVLPAHMAAQRTAMLLGAPVHSTKLAGLAQQALSISLALHVTVYDSLYLALAETLAIPFITNDHKLLSKMRLKPMPTVTIVWLGDF